MTDREPTINALKLKSGFAILIISLLLSFSAEKYILPEKGKISFFVSFMCLLAIYTVIPILRFNRVKLVLSCFIVIHIALLFTSYFTDSAYSGPVLLPFALGDYVLFAVIMQKCVGTE